MYFGSSPSTDFALCAGLGVAAVSCVLTAFHAVQLIVVSAVASNLQNAMRVGVFVVFSGALLAIVAVLGETKGVRDLNSTFGFAVGGALTVAMALVLRRLK